ncbi:MAG: tetratricopeptide repeat protein [Smithella sp.]
MERMDMADQLLKEEKYAEAIALLEELKLANPDEESILLRLAWAYHDKGATAKAVEYLEILLDRELQRKIFTGFAFDELVRIYKQEKNFSKLVEICATAAARQPDDVCLLSELGNAYLLADNTGEACRAFEKLVEMENDNPSFYCLLGEALFADGKITESEAAFLQAGKIDFDQTDRYYYKMANLYSKSRDFENAKRLLDACIAEKPANPLYHCCLGDALAGLGRIIDAQSEYEKAIQLDNSGAGAYYNRFGNLLARSNYHHEAMEAFRKALEIEPGNPVYTRHLALSYKALGLLDIADGIGKET